MKDLAVHLKDLAVNLKDLAVHLKGLSEHNHVDEELYVAYAEELPESAVGLLSALEVDVLVQDVMGDLV